MKGGASNVFAMYLMDAARNLEMQAKSQSSGDSSEMLQKLKDEFDKLMEFTHAAGDE